MANIPDTLNTKANDGQALANIIESTIYEFSNGELAASGSTLSGMLLDAGLSVIRVFNPGFSQ